MQPRDNSLKFGQLVRNFAALGAGSYGAMAVSLVINLVLTRRLGTEQFGRLTLLLMTSQVVSLLVANWTHTALVRFGAREFQSFGSVAEAFWTRVWILAPWVLGAAVVMLLFRERLATFLTIPAWGILVVLGHFLASLALSMVGAVFQAREQMRRYGAALLLDKAAMAVLMLSLPLAWLGDPLFVLGAYAVSTTAVTIWAALSLGRASLTPIVLNRAAYSTMLSFSLPLVISSWAGLFGTPWFDMLIIKAHRPLAELGLYSLGTLVAGVMQQITIVFSTLMLPHFSVLVANGEIERIERFVHRLFPYWLLGTSVLFSVTVLVAVPMVPLLFGRAFEPAVPVVALLMLATCALAFFTAFSPLVSAFGSTGVLTTITLVGGSVNVVVDLLLIPRYGILGAAFASVSAYLVVAVLALRFTQTRLETGLFRLGALALPIVIVCGGFFVFEGARFYLFAIPAASASVLWLIRRFHLFSPEDAGIIRDIRIAAPMATAGRAS
jgi:O-antigen/teichoic acid export membrane protein